MDAFISFVSSILHFVAEMFQPIVLELYREAEILRQIDAVLRLGAAAFCGLLIGVEREHAAKPAGVRTNVMVCVGSALFTLSSVLAAQNFPGTDATRIAAQVVSGVGFLGAGVILKTGTHLIGVTTAATIWLVAAIGVAIGLGFPLLGVFATVASAITLFLLGQFEFTHWLPHLRHKDQNPHSGD